MQNRFRLGGMLLAPLLSFVIAAPVFAQPAVDALLGGATQSASIAGLQTVNAPGVIIGNAINAVIGLIGIAFVIVLVYAGILYMTAAGVEEKVEKAKRLITSSIIGIVVVVAAYAIATFVIGQIAGALGVSSKASWVPTVFAAGDVSETIKGINATGSAAGFGGSAPSVAALVRTVINSILALTGVAFVLILVYGGILYLTAGGDTEKIGAAKRMMANAVIGIVIVAVAYSATVFLFDRLAEVLNASPTPKTGP